MTMLSAIAKVRLLILPYASAQGESLGQIITNELIANRWTRFSAAVAFVKGSGNYVDLLDALKGFATAGNPLAGDTTSEFDAVEA